MRNVLFLKGTIEMQLSRKQKNFSQSFFQFLRCRLHFEHFQKKMTPIVYVFRKLQTRKDVVRQMSEKSCFRKPFNKRHSKPCQTLLKSEDQLLYHIFWSIRRQMSWEQSLLVIWKISVTHWLPIISILFFVATI